MWTGIKPSISHLRIFGSLCYRHIPDQKRQKLDDKSEPMILIGYNPTGSYKLFNPVTKKILYSRDVHFDEAGFWEDIDDTIKSTQLHFDWEEEVRTETENTQVVPQSATEGTRSARVRNPSIRLRDYHIFQDNEVTEEGDLMQHMALMAGAEPVTFEEANINRTWRHAMEEEIRSIEKNRTWDLVDLPPGKVPIAVKWVFKTKLKPDGTIAKHKARLVAKGFMQKKGLNYEEVFAPVARMETVRLIVALASWWNWTLWQLDVKSAFLNGPLEEEIYIQQPQGFISTGKESKVLKLRKALYGLKQAPRAWNKRIDTFLVHSGFMKCTSEHGVYVKMMNQVDVLIICLYVDDLLITGTSLSGIEELKTSLKQEFEMSDLGTLTYFLGIEFVHTERGVLMHQKKYISEVLKRFNMQNCNSAETPAEINLKLDKGEGEPAADDTVFRQIVGSLRFICHTRPEISYAVGLVSRFMSNPRQSHLMAAKRVLRYLKGTQGYGVLFPHQEREGTGLQLVAYSDSDWCGDLLDRRSTMGYVFLICGAPVSWCSKKESVVALSTCEAEYIAACSAACQAVWLSTLLRDLKVAIGETVELQVDNKSAIDLAKNPVSHGRSKHIETKFHFIREQVSKGKIKLKHCGTDLMIADIMTKALKIERFQKLRDMLNVKCQ